MNITKVTITYDNGSVADFMSLDDTIMAHMPAASEPVGPIAAADTDLPAEAPAEAPVEVAPEAAPEAPPQDNEHVAEGAEQF